MARLEQHKAGVPMPSSGSVQDRAGVGALSLPGIRNQPLHPEPSFQFQAEKVLGQRLPRLG